MRIVDTRTPTGSVLDFMRASNSPSNEGCVGEQS
jgi:hypothetical protein